MKKNDQYKMLFDEYTISLEKVLELLPKEYNLIQNEKSLWSTAELDCVKKEIKILYEYAQQGIVHFRFESTRLESTHLMTDTFLDLFNTNLGKKISIVQSLYNQLYKKEKGIFSFLIL